MAEPAPPKAEEPQEVKQKKFLNGWTSEIEDLMADWADKAACYRWMHEKTSTFCQERDNYFNYPIIILSGLTASANFALNSIVGDDKEMQKWAQIGLGGASLITGILQTFMNKLGYAKNTEAHRVAGISWGKFNRLICIEMSLHPDERMDCHNFLKMFRVELDRLIEQSPIITEETIKKFNEIFKNTPAVVKPEIVGILQHTKVYKDSGARLKRIAAEATVALHFKRGVIKQLVVADLERKSRDVAIEEARKVAKEILDEEKAKQAAKRGPAPVTGSAQLAEKLKEERTKEVEELSKARAGAVSELKSRFMAAAGPKSTVHFANPVEQPPAPSAPATSEKDTIDTVITVGEVKLEPRQEAPPAAENWAERTDTSLNLSGFQTPGFQTPEAVNEEPEGHPTTGRGGPSA
jgi:hypothetical protein